MSLKKQACYRILNEQGWNNSGMTRVTDKTADNNKNNTNTSGKEKISDKTNTGKTADTDQIKPAEYDPRNVAELYNWYKYAKWTVYIVGSVAVLYGGFKLIKARRLAAGMTRGEMLAAAAKGYIESQAAGSIVSWAKSAGSNLKKATKNPETVKQIEKATGLTPADTDALLDLFGTIDWNQFQKELEFALRQKYYGGKIGLDKYLKGSYVPGTPAYETAQKWMPLMKAAREDKLIGNFKLAVGNISKFEQWFTGVVAEQAGPIIGLTPKEIKLLAGERTWMNKNSYDSAQLKAVRLTQQILKSLNEVPEEIINISKANPGQKFIDYKMWRAIQNARQRDSSQEYYAKLHYAYRVALHTGGLP